MDLNLIASDPDMSGGLGFLGTTQLSFGILGFAQSASFASEIANKVIYSGVPVEAFNLTTLRTGDIQSLADIGSSFEVIQKIRLVPMNLRVPIFMLLMIAVPFVPLITLKIPLSEILKSLAGFLF